MSNQLRFLCQTAVVCVALGLIAGLLPDLVAAQDLSTRAARKIISLSGEWEFATGSMDRRPDDFDKTVQVPGFHPAGDALWYRRTVTIEGSLPEVVRLEVKKASWGVKVWVNGTEAGQSWSIRTASFIDITPLLKGNGCENEIILRVCGAKELVPPEIPWLNHIRYLSSQRLGLYDSVNLFLCDAPYVVRAQAAPDLQDHSVKLAVTLRNTGPLTKPALLKVTIIDDSTGDIVANAEQPHRATAGDSDSELDITIPDAKLWSPESPHLYRFEIEVHRGSRHTDTFTSRFGMRSFSICQNTGRGLLNGRPILLTGAGQFSVWDAGVYDDATVRSAYRFIKSLRGNAVRICFELAPEIWYRIADEEGILVQDEAHWRINETATVEAVTAEFRDWIHERANHPCVVIWDAANESPNAVHGGPVLRKAMKAVRHLDLSNRPWDPCTWFPHTKFAPFYGQKGDVTEWHPYSIFIYLGDGQWDRNSIPEGFYPEIFEKGGQTQKPFGLGWVINEYLGFFLHRDGSVFGNAGRVQKFAEEYFKEANGNHYLLGRARFCAWEAEYYRRHPGCLGVMWNSYLFGAGPQLPVASQTLSERELALGRFIADASAPVGVMVDSWKTTIPTGRLNVPVSVANDGPAPWSGTVRLSLIRAGDNLSKTGALFEPPESQAEINQRTVHQWQQDLNEVPVSQQGEAVFDAVISEPGNYHFMAEITGLDGKPVRSWRDFVSIGDPVDRNIEGKTGAMENANQTATEDTGLVGWWKLDEKSGTVASDSSGHGNHGELVGGPTWVEGRIAGALHFANTDDTKICVDIPNSPTLENVQEGDWTVAAWVWPDGLPPGTKVTPAYGIIIKQGQHIGLVYDQDGLFKMQHHSTAGYSLAKSAPKPPKAWYYVAGVVSRSDGFVKVYVNGKLESTVTFTPGAKAREFGTRTWKLGIAGPDYTNFREALTGKVDDVRIYRRALSDAEIAALAAQ